MGTMLYIPAHPQGSSLGPGWGPSVRHLPPLTALFLGLPTVSGCSAGSYGCSAGSYGCRQNSGTLDIFGIQEQKWLLGQHAKRVSGLSLCLVA